MDSLIYLTIIVCAFFAEIFPKIDTSTVLKKLSLCVVIVGALVSLAGKQNYLIEFGVILYFVDKIIESQFYYQKRRRVDHSANN